MHVGSMAVANFSRSFWKPLHHPVEDAPLAHCDGKTVNEDDIVVADHIRVDYQGETIFLKSKEGYKWNYLNRQTPEEVTIFKNFDSDESVPAKRKKVAKPFGVTD
jgi:hypothetical protein